MSYLLEDSDIRRYKVVSMRLTESEWRALSSICTRTGRSVSDCLREAMGFKLGEEAASVRGRKPSRTGRGSFPGVAGAEG